MSLFFNAAVKYQDQTASWGAKSLFGLHFYVAVHHWRNSGQELKQDRKLGQELMQTEATEGCCLLACFPMACSVCFLIEPRTTRPGMASPTMGWSLPHWSLIEKMPCSWILWRHFLNWGSFLSDESSLFRVDTQDNILYKSTNDLNWIPITHAKIKVENWLLIVS